MAAPMVALNALSSAADVAGDQVSKFQANPWDYIADLLVEIGAILLLVGIALGFVGYYLKAYSVKAKGDAAQGIATVEGVFGNVSYDASQQPYLSVTGPNVANDVVNLGNDAWRGLTNTAGQAWADLKGIATAIDDIPKALVQLVSQGPGIAINGFLGLVTEALSDIFILVFPYAIIFGAAMLGGGVAMKIGRWTWDSYVAPEARIWIDRKVGIPLRDWVHRLFQNNVQNRVGTPRSGREREGHAVGSEVAYRLVWEGNGDDVPQMAGPGVLGEARGSGRVEMPGSNLNAQGGVGVPPGVEIERSGRADVSVDEIAASNEVGADQKLRNGPGTAGIHEGGTPGAPERPSGTLVAVPTSEQEIQLGGDLQGAKDRLRAAVRRQREGPVDPDYVGWAYGRIRATG